MEGGLKLERRAKKAWVVEAEEENYAADKPLQVKIPREKAASVIIEHSGDEAYFHVLDRPEVPGEKRERAKPKSIHLVWDASNSGAERDTKKELQLLDQFLAWVGDSAVTLTWLRNDLEKGGSFVVKNGQWGDLRRALEGVRYDGGTQLGLLDFRRETSDCVVLVSDGVSTLGKSAIEAGEKPVFALHASQSAEHGVLRGLVARSGGAYVNLSETPVQAGLAALSEDGFSLLRATVEGVEAAAQEVYPSFAKAVNGPVGVAGKLPLDGPATLVLQYGWGTKTTLERRVRLDPQTHHSKLERGPRLWAQKKLSDLEIDANTNRAAIIELAKAHGLVTRFTSLIVLDRIEDYVEHRIVPPTAKMRAEYERLLKVVPDLEEPDREHLKEMLVLWKERAKWHRQRFPEMAVVVLARVKALRSQMDDLRGYIKDAKDLDKEEEKIVGRMRVALRSFVALEKKQKGQSSAFYLDMADFFLERKERKIAVRILSNVAELNLESVPLLRILGHRLDQVGELELAEKVFREVKELRGDEPQSWRDLALILEKRKKNQEALDLMWIVVANTWNERFPEIQMVVLNELNALVARKGASLDLSAIDERLLKKLDCDLRIVLTWDADNTDIDLWVDGPAGERCDYNYNRTMSGGRMSSDFTDGYGPEEFLIRKALPGNYEVRANFYGNRQQVLAGATTVQAVLITNWGRPNEKREAVTLRLKEAEEVVEIGKTSVRE